jgi:hypothetical protein
MRSFFILLIVLVAPPPGFGQQATWFLLSHEDGCVDLKVLVEAEKLPRTPTSPEDYAQMMRERGKDVSLVLPKDLPSDFRGKVVQVRTSSDDAGPVFIRGEVCDKLGASHRS